MSIKTLATAAMAATMALGSVNLAQASSPVPGKPGDGNLVEIALAVNAATGEFDYLLAAATCEYFGGAVVALLSGEDKYTLFAPTDAAFENLQRALGVTTPSPEVTCSLDPAYLFDVLAYHVTDGRRFSNSVFNQRAVKMVGMLNDQYVVTNPNLTLNDNVGQTIGIQVDPATGKPLANINARNGVIHVIDTVLLPSLP